MDQTITITPAGADKVQIDFTTFTFASDAGDLLYVFDGPTTMSPQITSSPFLYNNPPPSSFTSTGTSVTIKLVTNAGTNAAGFKIDWKAKWNAGQAKVTPQLKSTRIIVMTKTDANGLTAPSAITSADAVWDMNNTQPLDASTIKYPASSDPKFYSESWYTTNKTSIDAVTLKSVVFTQDYSLARKYYNNKNIEIAGTTKGRWPNKVHDAVTVVPGMYSSSGKLTLNEIISYEYKFQKIQPSVKFDYNYSVANDNPDYNPKATDYWGFYKSDITDSAYTGYTTSTSKDFTDAWSMRKITTPLGGTIEMEYESDSYEKTFSESGGFKGPSRIYMLRSVSGVSTSTLGTDWNIVLEDDVSDFWDLINSPPSGTTRLVYVPFTTIADDSCWNNTDECKIWGSGTVTQSPKRVTGLTGSNHYTRNFTSNPTDWTQESTPNTFYSTGVSPPCGTRHLVYTGNGYINFDIPSGNSVYGGGIRVKKITTKNNSTEGYVTEYTYSVGVTPAEADRFGKPAQRKDTYDGTLTYIKLRPYEGDPHRMSPGVGYTKVTVKNLGRSNTANGSVTTTYITSETTDNFKVRKKLSITVSSEYTGTNPCSDLSYNDTSYVVEVVDKYSGMWGKPSIVEVADVNGNLLSVTRNEYANPLQGSIVENYDFVRKRGPGCNCNPGCNCTCTQNHHIICIKRNYPVVLSKQTVYSKGISATTEYVRFDEITGVPISVRSTGPNKSTVVDKNVHAFRISDFSSMGPKSVNSSNKNMTGPFASNRVTVDSTITTVSDFGSYSVSTFGAIYDVRKYSITNSQFEFAPCTLDYRPLRSYIWQGNSSSLSTYGLFKNTDFVAFDWDLSSVDAKWKFVSQVTLFDSLGAVLETKGINSRYSAVRYTKIFHQPVAQISNSNYPSFTFSSFEDRVNTTGSVYHYEGEVKENSGVQTDSSSTVAPHSGKKVIKLASAGTGPSYSVKYNNTYPEKGLTAGRKYRAAVWVYNSSASTVKLTLTLTGQSTKAMAANDAAAITVGSWKLLWFDYDVPSSLSNNDELKIYVENTSGADVYFDDMRLQCADAVMSCNVYHNKTGWLIGTLGNDHFATIYKHDAGGRIVEVWQEIEGVGLKKIKKNTYNFGRGLN